MKHLVFLLDFCYPYFSATSECCFNVAEELSQQHRVTVVCLQSYTGQPTSEQYQSINIVRVSHRWWTTRLILSERAKGASGAVAKWYRLLLNGVRVKQYLETWFTKVSIQEPLVSSFLGALYGIRNPIDALVPSCYPMEAVVAAMEFKRQVKGIKLVPYLFDPFVESRTLHRTAWNRNRKRRAHLQIERDMLELSSKVFCVDQTYKHLVSVFDEFSDSLVLTEHPLLKKNVYVRSGEARKNEKTVITYTGVLDYRIRNPEFFLETMELVLPECDAELHLYTYGNCEGLVQRRAASNRRIVRHGFVPKHEADAAVAQSNVLIGIGNLDNLQVSSKIFGYMAAGKPIIYFYTSDNDANLRILAHYPLCICLKQDRALMGESVEKCIAFCRENRDKTLEFEAVERAYPHATPRFVANQMLSVIDH